MLLTWWKVKISICKLYAIPPKPEIHINEITLQVAYLVGSFGQWHTQMHGRLRFHVAMRVRACLCPRARVCLPNFGIALTHLFVRES